MLTPRTKVNKPKLKAIAILTLVLAQLMQGCIVSRIMDSEDRKHYSEYMQETQRINLEREKAGLAPQKTATFEEWKGGK